MAGEGCVTQLLPLPPAGGPVPQGERKEGRKERRGGGREGGILGRTGSMVSGSRRAPQSWLPFDQGPGETALPEVISCRPGKHQQRNGTGSFCMGETVYFDARKGGQVGVSSPFS